MQRTMTLVYGSVAYTAFVATFLYAMGFVANTGVPKSIDSGPAGPLSSAILINLSLLSLFAIQHSGMARRGFKQAVSRFVAPQLERSTYVLSTCAVLATLYWLWEPMPAVIWSIENPIGRTAMHGLSALGWVIALLASFMISHFELFGLRQVWLHFSARKPKEPGFQLNGFYRFVRHPLQTGFLIAFWATPDMTAGHLLFSVVVSAYIFLSVKFLEERDLVKNFGATYRRYQQQVPMFLPIPRRRRNAAATSLAAETPRS